MNSPRLAIAALLLSPFFTSASDWPQWRGPDRSNVSTETGLLGEWPKAGPPLAWRAKGFGMGVAPVAVAGGKAFTTGYKGDEEYCTAVSTKDGRQVWTSKVGPAVKELELMRHIAQRTPTVDGERIYVTTAFGEYVCLDTSNGKELWRKSAIQDFSGKRHAFGFCDYPFVDGDRLILTPAGEKSTMIAVDKKTGTPIWTCSVPGGETNGHSVLVPMMVDGIRQYVNHLSKSMIGVAAADGKRLWQYDGMQTRTAVHNAPIIRGTDIFFATSYGAGIAHLRIARKDGAYSVTELYREKNPPGVTFQGWLGSSTQVGESIYINATKLTCFERATGQPVWSHPIQRCTYTVADNHFYIRSLPGVMSLAKVDPKGYGQTGEFPLPFEKKSTFGSSFPVVARGHLFVREEDELLCYDVREPDRRKPVPDAVFVPTPNDVVGKLLALADVKKADVVYDLGSGDGRIVVAAAKTYGCNAVGIELEKALVEESRKSAAEAGVSSLATFEYADLFDADFSQATVVAVYLLPTMNAKLIPKFNKLKAGSRIVAHHFPIPGITADRVTEVTSEEDDQKRKLYLYTVPLKPQVKTVIR